MDTTPHITILIASDQSLMVEGLRTIIQKQPYFKLVHQPLTSYELMEKAQLLNPDLIILDKHFGSFFDERNFDQLTHLFANHKVLLFSELDKEWIYKNHKLGITGFVTTTSSADEITEAIFSCAKGLKYFSPKIVEVLIELSFRKAPDQTDRLHDSLSEREMEIFMLVTNGKSTKDIADTLHLSTHTVYTHRKNILKKLSCKNATDLLSYAYAQGLIEKEQ